MFANEQVTFAGALAPGVPDAEIRLVLIKPDIPSEK
jgi:hypothetical protein